MADVSVRPAVPDDADEIGRIQVQTWRTAYADVLPEQVLTTLDAGAAAEAWRTAIGARMPAHHVLVAMEGPHTVGFAATAPAGDDDAATDTAGDAATVLIAPLLVEPRWGRRGHGSRLLAAAVDLARTDGLTRAVLWVPERDQVTQDFLASAGWQPEGTVRALDTGAGDLRELRFHADLTE